MMCLGVHLVKVDLKYDYHQITVYPYNEYLLETMFFAVSVMIHQIHYIGKFHTWNHNSPTNY